MESGGHTEGWCQERAEAAKLGDDVRKVARMVIEVSEPVRAENVGGHPYSWGHGKKSRKHYM
jgi:hypothetical protein